ncbi:hypothetical protein BDQ12DRAFT_723262 [Crucibulum laeve]|uniref:Uncharacterized protein n=1 Tax=Crucibulum laeve TaxID=68775 RepID=A0A5C3M126_9AGAR|nr:hypothetical protein BDQ12DRAFT_723262 [Crucibulum laeve]
MMRFPFAVGLLSILLSVQAQPPVVPQPGLFCCPPYGPDGLPLDRQQVGPFNIFCYYSTGTDKGCFYNPATGQGALINGCPGSAPANPHPPTCPI